MNNYFGNGFDLPLKQKLLLRTNGEGNMNAYYIDLGNQTVQFVNYFLRKKYGHNFLPFKQLN